MSTTPQSHVPIVLPKTEEELDQMKCEQRREQNRQWAQTPEEDREEIRKHVFSGGNTDLEPLMGAEIQ